MGPSPAWLSKKLADRGLLIRHNEQSRDHNLHILKNIHLVTGSVPARGAPVVGTPLICCEQPGKV